jgi:serpin B
VHTVNDYLAAALRHSSVQQGSEVHFVPHGKHPYDSVLRAVAVFILGEVEDVTGKLAEASYEETVVKLPKFEIETALDHRELVDFCRMRGCDLPFNEAADFSAMSDFRPLFISDILQKTKIKTDEKGIEAAAATMIMMAEGAAPAEESEIKEFIADHPFRFMILTDSDSPEPLFLGRLAE